MENSVATKTDHPIKPIDIAHTQPERTRLSKKEKKILKIAKKKNKNDNNNNTAQQATNNNNNNNNDNVQQSKREFHKSYNLKTFSNLQNPPTEHTAFTLSYQPNPDIPSRAWNAPPRFENDTVEQYAESLYSFLKRFKWCWKVDVNKFFQDDFCSREPLNKFLPHLDKLTPVELQRLAVDTQIREEWDSELKFFVENARQLIMPREPGPSKSPKLDRLFKFGMSPKKLHEVETMASFVDQYLTSVQHPQCENHTIIDIGCGKGYLSQVLADAFQFNVVGVEGADSIVEKETKRREWLNTMSQKKTFQEESKKSNKGHRIDKFLSTFTTTKYYFNCDTDQTEFETLIKKNLIEMQPVSEDSEEVARKFQENDLDVSLVGLHCCGNLSYSMLRLFGNWKSAQSIVNVGCCYDKLFIEAKKNVPFPMSKTVKKIIGDVEDARYIVRGVGSLACEVWHEFYDASPEGLMHRQVTLFYRALVDTGLHAWFQQKKLRENDEMWFALRKIKSVDNFSSWETYLKIVAGRIRLIWKSEHDKSLQEHERQQSLLAPPTAHSHAKPAPEVIPNWNELWEHEITPFLNQFLKKHENQQRYTLNYLAIQYTLAPVAESLLILDRYLYLAQDLGAAAKIVPIFDPHVSSKNLALFATKRPSSQINK